MYEGKPFYETFCSYHALTDPPSLWIKTEPSEMFPLCIYAQMKGSRQCK
jgi:hypothetical protein